MYLFDGFLIVIIFQSLVMGFRRGLSPVILRLFKYVSSLLFISMVLPNLTHGLLEVLGLKKTIYVSLIDLIPTSTVDSFYLYDLDSFPVEGIIEQIIFIIQELGLSESWELFILSFLEGERADYFLTQVFTLYPETALTLGEMGLFIFSYVAAFYLIFAFLSLFSFLFICLFLETLFSTIQANGEDSPLLGRLFSASLNLPLTIFFLLFLLQILSPIFEYFTFQLQESLLLQYMEPLLNYFEIWYRQMIL